MKMNKKGFTLIELLAVIVILAVIALIASPIILGIINDMQESARVRSVEAYVKAVEDTAGTYMLVDPNVSNLTICTGDTKPDPYTCHIDGTKAAKDSDKTEGVNDEGKVVKYVKYKGNDVVCAGATYANGVVSVDKCTVGGDTTTYSTKEGKIAKDS